MKPQPASPNRLVAIWCVLVVLFAGGATGLNWASLVAEQERLGVVAHRIVSQRVAQHDAHLTGLLALALANDPPPKEALGLVATTIRQFYPRVAEIDLVALDGDAEDAVMTTREKPAAAAVALVRATARLGSRKPEIVASPDAAGRYLLVKRVPNTDAARFGLALEIDGTRLADLESVGPTASRPQLAMPDATPLTAPPARSAGALPWPPPVVTTFEKRLGSPSQPLILSLRREVPLADLVPWLSVALFAALTAGAMGLLQRYRAARMSEHAATAQAAFRAQEVRLAHASRINAMGELALGIAHELTQPISAVLSQSQAGLRMVQGAAGDPRAVTQVLEANVRHARRAGDILGKLRDWVSLKPSRPGPVEINAVAADVVALMRGELERRSIDVTLVLAEPTPIALADPIELEQVVYNLVSNAADACERQDGGIARIQIRTFASAGTVALEIHDDGPGVPAGAAQRIFEPFYTSKPGGMGLGLALCQRLVERASGQILTSTHASGGAIFTVSLPALDHQASALRQAAE